MRLIYTGWFRKLLGLSRLQKRLVMVVVDVGMIGGVVLLAGLLKFGWLWTWHHYMAWSLFPLAVLVCIPTFFHFGLYRAVVRHSDGRAVWQITKAVLFGILFIVVINELSSIQMVPRSVIATYGIAMLVLLSASRLLVRWSFHVVSGLREMPFRAAIYGANDVGAQLVLGMRQKGEIAPMLFLEDNRELQGCEIMGLDVYDPSRVEKLIEEFKLTHIILCMPDAPRKERMRILGSLEKYPVHVKQTMMELIEGKPIQHIVEVNIADLLGREIVPPNVQLLGQCITGKVVMVTGAGGSIGSELCRQILRQKPSCLIAYELSEIALYQIEREFSKRLKGRSEIEFMPILGNILDETRVGRVMERFGVQTVYHAAAYKHVPIVEHNAAIGVLNNIKGTEVLVRSACHHKVESFVLISTDKAVRPTNVMGATKRVAELILQGYSDNSCPTRFCMVRFGNVLGSSGSVVPLFREQIANGGPVTVTHPEVTRYFMTIPEAAELVIQAGSMGNGGDVFVLDMGEPVKILDLAKRMIRLVGLTVKDEEDPKGDIPVQFSGLRPGEKLFEELLIGSTNIEGTEHRMIMSAKESYWPKNRLDEKLASLYKVCEKNDELSIKEILRELVEGYVPSKQMHDLIDSYGSSDELEVQPIPPSSLKSEQILH